MEKEKWLLKNVCFAFYSVPKFEISFSICGYFDNRPCINLSLLFFSLTIILPFRNSWRDECDPPKWGIAIQNKALWLYGGGKGNNNGGNNVKIFDMPFISLEWYRHSILLKDGFWEHKYKGDKKNFCEEEWDDKKAVWNYNYTDKYDGEVIPTTIYVKEMEWRRKWMGWNRLFNLVNRTIDVHFSKECGSRKGTWKGGCINCSYPLLPNENPIDCIKRMEKEGDI